MGTLILLYICGCHICGCQAAPLNQESAPPRTQPTHQSAPQEAPPATPDPVPTLTPPATPDPASEASPTSASAPATTTTNRSIDAVLDAMELQGATMKDFTATAIVEKIESLTQEREVRRGRVVVVGPCGAERQVGIAMDEFIDSTGRGSTDSRRFLFREGWLLELDPAKKQLIRRQLARAGEAFDPLRIGEGPFPVPLGQPKRDVLREFTVEFAPRPTATFFRSIAADDPSIIALRLVPRTGTAIARDTAAMTILLQAPSMMPRGVEVESVNGDRTLVLLKNARLNEGLDDAARALLSAPSTEGWKVDTRPLQ